MMKNVLKNSFILKALFVLKIFKGTVTSVFVICVEVIIHLLLFSLFIVYKNIQAQIRQKIKSILRISSASVLAIVFCFFLYFFEDFLD